MILGAPGQREQEAPPGCVTSCTLHLEPFAGLQAEAEGASTTSPLHPPPALTPRPRLPHNHRHYHSIMSCMVRQRVSQEWPWICNR